MDGRKTQAARARASARFRGKKPKIILLTQEQMNAVTEALCGGKSQLITQRLWDRLQPVLNMNRTSFARRATLTGFDVSIGYAWEEYEWGVHSTKALVQTRCIHCGSVHVMLAKKLFARRHAVQACPRCYSSIYLYDVEWRAKNSASQLVAQNRPETLERHRENSRAMWVGEHGKVMRDAQQRTVSDPTYKANMARIMRIKWASDPDYRDRVSGKGIYKHTGIYDGSTVYHSKLELAFLLWCADNRKHVVRCNFSVPYIDPEDGCEHDYYPDFIVDGSIVEVKGQRWIDAAPTTWRAKVNALAYHCGANGASYRVVLDKDLKAYARKASAYHEAQKQDGCPVQG
jgi:hypothetical protein